MAPHGKGCEFLSLEFMNIGVNFEINEPAVQRPQNNITNSMPTKQELENDGYSEHEIQRLKASGKIECQTCASRRYVDGSDDPGVSFKTPTKLTPGQSATAVMSHEQEHVTRNAAEAERENREVVSSSVTIYRDVCPECGVSYVSGGVTRTATQKMKEKDHFKNKAYEETIGKYYGKDIGQNIDERV